jgi:hypothetical protein
LVVAFVAQIGERFLTLQFQTSGSSRLFYSPHIPAQPWAVSYMVKVQRIVSSWEESLGIQAVVCFRGPF